jgi:hypothetical protein
MEVITTNQLTTKFKRSKEKNEKKIEREREREPEAEDFGCLCGNLMRGILFKICPSPPIIAFFCFTFLFLYSLPLAYYLGFAQGSVARQGKITRLVPVFRGVFGAFPSSLVRLKSALE